MVKIFAMIFGYFLWGGVALADATTHALQCQQKEAQKSPLACNFRLSRPGDAPAVTANAGTTTLPVSAITPYPATDQTSVFLFLIDVSDPSRRATVEKNAQLIKKLLEVSKPHHRFGVAVFDSEMRVLAPLGAERAALEAAIPKIVAGGMTTEFYRSIMDALRLLVKFEANRKALVVISDGMAEDRAYRHEDVVPLAQSAGVVIYGLGYAEKVAHTPSLQLLRRLADETGGPFAAADTRKELPEELKHQFFDYLDNGGTFTVDLKNLTGKQNVTILIKQAGAEDIRQVQEVVLPEPVPEPAPAPEPVPLPPWHVQYRTPLLAGGTIVLLLILFLTTRKKHKKNNGKIYAYLDMLDAGGSHHPVATEVMRIGRNANNDLQLNNDSVSGFHAEIHRNRSGDFTITDLNSTNGILVNGQEVKSQVLAEDDILEIGEVRMRFRRA
ncbi:MAG: FHA domain-containing protein [Magnetococcales bacterium]|nr:FHA domain-containing protein [Magnetococcales bacterium]